MTARDMFVLSAKSFVSKATVAKYGKARIRTHGSDGKENHDEDGDDDDDDAYSDDNDVEDENEEDDEHSSETNGDVDANPTEGRRLEEVSNDDDNIDSENDDDNIDSENDDAVADEKYGRAADGCVHQYYKMKMAGYGHYIVERVGRHTVETRDPALKTAHAAVVRSVREMIETCQTLDRILHIDITPEVFEDPDKDTDTVYEYLMAAIALVEMKTIPGIDLPMPSTDMFVANVWKYLLPTTFDTAETIPSTTLIAALWIMHG